jgi:hypothetical protein
VLGRRGAVVDVLAELAAVAADGERQALHRHEADAAFEIHAVRARGVLVAGAVHDGYRVIEHAFVDLAARVQTPVRRGAEFETVDDHVLDEAVAVEVLDERHPRQVGRAQAADECI